MIALPMKTVERLADVEESKGTTDVSPMTTATARRHAELLRGNLGKDRARALPHVGRARQDRRAAVVVQADDRQRGGGRGGALQAERDPTPAILRQRSSNRSPRRPDDGAPNRRRPACRLE